MFKLNLLPSGVLGDNNANNDDNSADQLGQEEVFYEIFGKFRVHIYS